MKERREYTESFRQQALEKVFTRGSNSIRVVAFYPGYLLDPNAAVGTLNPARCIYKKYLITPHRDELETPLRQGIVTGSFAAAAAAHRAAVQAGFSAVQAGFYLNLKRWNRCIFNPTHVAVDK